MSSTHNVHIGNRIIGGNMPILIQSMCSTNTADVKATITQIHRLEKAGCEIIRIAVPDMQAVKAIPNIKKAIRIPLAADIHFDHRLAVASVKHGVDKIRINPGNIGGEKKIKEIVSACKDHNTAIRIGVNAGSLKYLKDHSSLWRRLPVNKRAGHLVQEALEYISLIESMGFKSIVVSLKAADITTSTAAYRLMSTKTSYPLHVGITEAGSLIPGIVKSTIGIAGLLAEGIGDTIRVSLTADPVYEVKCAKEILKNLKLRTFGPEIISCPTCARCKTNIIKVVHNLESQVEKLQEKKVKFYAKKIAVMGCMVNGPGEARDADIGIAGGKGTGLLFKNGKAFKQIQEKQWVSEILKIATGE
ncbi:MAG: flavodoxin-dependent (E)-4-hydroxy-3-methylbut-2-enyl-diphosphate synthase [bacterium]